VPGHGIRPVSSTGIRLAVALAAVLAVSACSGQPAREARALSFPELDGWAADDHAAALDVFRGACAGGRFGGRSPPHWAALCVAAAGATDARAFFERHFRPVRFGDPGGALFTAYYEPVLPGSRTRAAGYSVPLYAPPADLAARQPHFSRAEIEAGALSGQGLELLWLADPVEAYFLQVQGSGRVRLPDGTSARIGYAGKNGHPYRSLGRLLVERGEMPLEAATARGIRDWLNADPARGAVLMDENPSYVFFREVADLPPEAGPIGTLGIPLTPRRSAAVDPDIYTLGLPVWIEAETPAGPVRRLMLAADTGGAIRGPQRADLFLGTGDAAGEEAGATRSGGRLVALVPARPRS